MTLTILDIKMNKGQLSFNTETCIYFLLLLVVSVKYLIALNVDQKSPSSHVHRPKKYYCFGCYHWISVFSDNFSRFDFKC